MGFEINQVTVSGNLTADPELRSLPGGTSVGRLRIANNERYRDSTTNEWMDRTNYFDVTVWAGQAEWICNNVQKGMKVVVQGQLRFREWDDKESGKKRSAVDINARDIIPVPRMDSNGGGGGFQAAQGNSDFGPPPSSGFAAPAQQGGFAAQPAQQPAPAQPAYQQPAPSTSDDIPF